MNIKKIAIGVSASAIIFGALATAVLAAPPTNPGTYGTAATNAQCGTAASSGAFNFQNEVYGEVSPLDNNNSLNSSGFGLDGGSGGGQTGLNNSAVCGNRQGNL